MNSGPTTGIAQRDRLHYATILGSRHFVWVVLALGFALRLGWVLAWDNEQFIGDYIWLNDRAKDLAAGKGYVQATGEPTAFWPIGYPLGLSMLYRLFGPHDVAGKIANVLFSMATLGGTYLLARRFFLETAGRLALLLLAFSPNQIAYNSLLATEPVFTALLVVALLAVFVRKQDRWTGLVVGVILGVTCNIKPVTLGLFPVFFVCLWALRRDWLPAATHTAIAVAVTVLLLTPWMIRNYVRFDRWLLTNEAGLVLLVGNNPEATGQYHRSRVIAEIYPKIQRGGQDEYRYNKEAQRLAVQFIRENPDRFLVLGMKKLYHMYKHDVDGIWHALNGVKPFPEFTRTTLTRLGHLYYAGLMLFVVGYLAQCVCARALLSIPNLWLLFVCYFSFVCFVFHGLPRYHFPLMPIFCAYAAHFIESASRCLGESKT